MIKKIILIFILCSPFYAQMKVAVSIPPQAFFVKQIAQDLASVYVMVPDNRNPESYEPLMSQMRDIRDAVIYFGIGLDFEHQWKDRFLASSKSLDFVYPLGMLDTAKHGVHHDSHVWISLRFVRDYARQIADVFASKDEDNRDVYSQNLEKFLVKVDELDRNLQSIFAGPNAKKVFLVFHPAFEYLASEYGLKEIAIESENKELKIRHMQFINREIQRNNLKVIYKQPQFSDRQVSLLARHFNLKISELDPLKYNWLDNMLEMASRIANEE